MGFRVLIVDDEKMPREILREHIDWASLQVTQVQEACDGAEALEIAKKLRPHIIISDIKMPKMNGIVLAQNIREILPECRFAFLSGYADKDNLKQAIALKASSFVEKPIDLNEVTQVLTTLVNECKSLPPDEKMMFFRNCSNGDPLNDGVFTLAKDRMRAFEQLAKNGQEPQTKEWLRNVAFEMRRCESSDIDYLRNIFCQIVFFFSNQAETRNAVGFLKNSEHYIYVATHASCINQIEEEMLQMLGEYFSEAFSAREEPLARLNRYLQEHFAEPDITIKRIAQDLNFTDTYLCMLYKKSTGKTINGSLTSLRIQKACELLKTTPLQLYRVGEAVGYRDGKYFFRVFQKEIGMTPREYRERGCRNA